jgi:hypothetical protein
MKRRYRYMLNLFSLALLAFALYLNFVKEDGAEAAVSESKAAPAAKPKEASATGHTAQTFVLK